MNAENITEIQSRFEKIVLQREPASVVKIVEMAGTVDFALALKLTTCSKQILSQLPETMAAAIRDISKYIGPTILPDVLDAKERTVLAAQILDAFQGKVSISPAIDNEKPIKTFHLKRRFLNLDWEQKTYSLAREIEYVIVHNSFDSAWELLRSSLDNEEGTNGVFGRWPLVDYGDRTGFYFDENLEEIQISSLGRMHWDGGTTFDYLHPLHEVHDDDEESSFLLLKDVLFRKNFRQTVD